VFSLPPLRRLQRLFAPPAAFAAAFVRSLRRGALPSSARAQALSDLQAQLRALQAQLAHWQSQMPQAEALAAPQAAINSVSDGVLLFDNAGHFAPNPTARVLFGLGDAPDTPFFPPGMLRYPSGQAVPPGALPWVQAAQTQLPTEFAPFLVAQGTHSPRAVEIAARPTAGGAAVVVRDLSARQAAQARETQIRHMHRALSEAARRLSRTSDFQTLCRETTDAALALLPPETRADAHAHLCTFDGQGQPLVLRAASPDEGKKRPRLHAHTLPTQWDFDAQSPLLWKVYLDRQIVAAPDIEADPLFAQPRERALLQLAREMPYAARSVVMLPLLPGAAAAGHLLLLSPRPDAFSPDTVDALALLAALSASALARAQTAALLHRQDDQFAALQQAALAARDLPRSATLAARDLPGSDAFADTLCRCAADALGAAVGVCFLVDTSAQTSSRSGLPLRLWGTPPLDTSQFWETSPPDTSRLSPARGPSLARCACTRAALQALRRGLPVAQIGIPNPPLGECPWAQFGGQSGTHSALAVPLRHGDAACGALAVFRHGGKPFSPHETRLAETFAALASLALPGAD